MRRKYGVPWRYTPFCGTMIVMAEARRIACVDDEETLRTTLSYALSREGYLVDTYADGIDAWEAFRARLPDLAVIDIIMPGMDGLDLCRKIREKSDACPIIFLTSKDEEIDRVLGLEIGGDDYLCKPFSMRELIARIKVILRRVGAGVPAADGVTAGSGTYRGGESLLRGNLRIDPLRYTASWNGRELVLTVTEFRLLHALAADPRVVKTREQLLEAAYPEDLYVSDRAVDSHIKRIRRKILDMDSGFDAIETVYGLGYRYHPGE